MKRCAFTLFAGLFLVACANGDQSISAAIRAQFDSSPSAPVELGLLGPKDWDRVCIIGPYSDNVEAERIFGFQWDVESKTSIMTNEGVNLLVFIKDREVLAFTEHPRKKGDFQLSKQHCFARANAVFTRKVGSSGWVSLVAN
jgi:hypothetical protein